MHANMLHATNNYVQAIYANYLLLYAFQYNAYNLHCYACQYITHSTNCCM